MQTPLTNSLLTILLVLLTFIGSCQKPTINSSRKSSTPQQLTMSTPEKVGMSTARLSRIDSVLQVYIDKKWMPGYVSLVACKGKIVHYKSFGYKDIATKELMEKEDIFRIMSMTKAITSVVTMMLYEEGKFLLDDPACKYIPQFKNATILKKGNNEDTTYVTVPATSEVTIRQLLSHTAGISYSHPLYRKAGIPDFFSLDDLSLSQTMPKLASMPLMHEPVEIQMLANGGEFNGSRILSRKTIELMTANQIGEHTIWDSKNKIGLGFEIVSEEGHAIKSSFVGSFSWGGMFYTSFWIDPKEELIAVFMTQVWPIRHGDLQDKLRIAVYQSIIN